MRKLIYFCVSVLLLVATAFGLLQIANSRTYQVFGEVIPRVETTQKMVALTFDDGPTPEFTDEILKVLAEQNIKATFFLIGKELERHLEEGKKIVAAGHEVGNHSYSHTRMVFVTPSFVKEEVEKTDELIRAMGYENPTHFRSPYCKKLVVLPYYLSQTSRKNITFDVEPETFPKVSATTEEIVKYVVANTREGSIILLHVMYDRKRKSLNAVTPIIEGLREKGFRFATVSELLNSQV